MGIWGLYYILCIFTALIVAESYVFATSIHFYPSPIFVGKARSLPEWSKIPVSTLMVGSYPYLPKLE
jgi:hypothetical protein